MPRRIAQTQGTKRSVSTTDKRDLDTNGTSIQRLNRKRDCRWFVGIAGRLIGAIPCEIKPQRDGIPMKSFTADFVVTEDDEVLFLEGGPPHTALWGAHPCCFVPGNVEGVALMNRNEGRI